MSSSEKGSDGLLMSGVQRSPAWMLFWKCGRVWLMALVLKTRVGNTTGGSNPSTSAESSKESCKKQTGEDFYGELLKRLKRIGC